MITINLVTETYDWPEDDDEIRESVLAYLEYETMLCGHNQDIVVYACF